MPDSNQHQELDDFTLLRRCLISPYGVTSKEAQAALRRIEERLETADQKIQAHHSADLLEGESLYRCLICEHVEALNLNPATQRGHTEYRSNLLGETTAGASSPASSLRDDSSP